MTVAQRDALRRQTPLLNYLRQRGWKPLRDTGRQEVSGLCPLHPETHPSFYVNRSKEAFSLMRLRLVMGFAVGIGMPRLSAFFLLARTGWMAEVAMIKQRHLIALLRLGHLLQLTCEARVLLF